LNVELPSSQIALGLTHGKAIEHGQLLSIGDGVTLVHFDFADALAGYRS
jgi:hypothetical protein